MNVGTHHGPSIVEPSAAAVFGLGRATRELAVGKPTARRVRPTGVAAAAVVAGLAAALSAVTAIGGCDRSTSAAADIAAATRPAVGAADDARTRQPAVGLLIVRGLGELPEPGRPVVSPTADEVAMLQATFVHTLLHDSLFTEAISSSDSKIRLTDWFKGFEAQPDPMAARRRNLREQLRANPVQGSRLIRVELATPAPEDALTILTELCETLIRKQSLERVSAEAKQVELMSKQMKLLQNELEDVYVQQRAHGQELAAAGVVSGWNGQRAQLERVIQEQSRIRGRVAGVEAQVASLDDAQRDGRVPAEVRQAVEREPRYAAARKRVDDQDAEVDKLSVAQPAEHASVAAAKKLRDLYQERADRIREEYVALHTEARRSAAQNDLAAMKANSTVLDFAVAKLGKILGQMGEGEAAAESLRQRERRLRSQVDAYESDVRRIREFRLAVPWSQVQWSSKPSLEQ